MDELIKMWYKYMEYSSAIRKYKFFPFAATWMDLEDIMLCEKNTTEGNKYSMILFIGGMQFTKQTTSQTEKNSQIQRTCACQKGEGQEHE